MRRPRSGAVTTDDVDARRGGDTALRTAPDHLAVWLPGVVDGHQDPLLEDAGLDERFDTVDWVDSVRAGHAAAVITATHRGRDPRLGGDPHVVDDDVWIELVRHAAGAQLGGEDRAFTGDTTPTSLRSLRRWTSDQLSERPDLVDDAVLVVSELSTNVERHARSWLTVDVVEVAGHVVVAVTDPDVDALPVLREVPRDEPSGRGLLVVSSLASWWGVVVRPRTKTVWAALRIGGADDEDRRPREEHV